MGWRVWTSIAISALLIGSSSGVSHNASGDVESEKKLHELLLHTYNKDVRPAPVDKPVEVEVGLSVIRLHSFDTKNEMLECQAWLRLAWKDVSLRWKPTEHGDVTELTVAANKIWTPDIKLYNSVDHVDNIDPDLNALVFYTGHVAYIPRMTLRSHCNINKTAEGKPHNDQVCPLRFGSWVYNGLMVRLYHQHRSDVGHVDLSDYIPKSKYEWFIRGATAKLNNKQYPCCRAPFPDITFHMKMHREKYEEGSSKTYSEYLHVKAVDTKITVFNIGAILLIPLIFLLPHESKAKVTLGATGLVCLVFILMNSPDDYTAKLCEVNIIIVSVAMLVTTILMNLWHSESSQGPIPSGLQRIVGVLARIVCARHPPRYDNDDCAQLDDVNDDSTLRVITPKSSRYLYSWRTLVVVADRLCFIIFLVVAILCNIATH